MTAPASDAPVVLRSAGRPVGRYVTRPALPARLSPRPCLHPVTTLAGTTVTELSPAEHPHHLGVGAAVPDVEGHSFWGGRTHVRDQGPTEPDDHGAQRHGSFQLRDPDGLVAELRWVAAGTELLRERRTAAATEPDDTAWALDFTFSLADVTSTPLSLGSPATNGRPGAACGGFFWRARKEGTAPDVFTAAAQDKAIKADIPADTTIVGVGRNAGFKGFAEYRNTGPGALVTVPENRPRLTREQAEPATRESCLGVWRPWKGTC